jgi:uncharacterized protein (DUF983 family)
VRETPSPNPPAVKRTALRRSLRLLCPQCGVGRVPTTFGRVAKACSSCGLVFRREDGALTGSMYLTAIVSQVFAASLIFLVWFLTDWGVALSIGVCLPLVFVFSYVCMPYAQSLWVGVEYCTDVANNEDWVEPRS